MSAQHTPGPWSVRGKVLRNARGESIASGGNNRAIQGAELEASLTLAAAAPDLLQALIACRACVDDESIALADAAIAKATGAVS